MLIDGGTARQSVPVLKVAGGEISEPARIRAARFAGGAHPTNAARVFVRRRPGDRPEPRSLDA